MSQAFTRPASQTNNWQARLAPHVRPYRGPLLLSIALSVIGQISMGLLPLLQKIIVDDAVIAQRRPLWPWLSSLVLLGAVSFGLQYFRRYLSAKTSLDLQQDLRLAIHRHLHALDFAHHDRLSAGDVMSRAAGDVTLIQMFLNQVPMLAANLTLLVVALSVMVVLSPTLCLVIAVFVPGFLLLAVRFRDRIFPSSWNDQRLVGVVAGVVEEAVSGARVVRAFAQEHRELALLIESARQLFRSRLRTTRLTARYSSTLQALPAFAQLGVLLLGGLLALHGRVSLGVFLAFSSYLIQLLAPIRLLSGMLSSSQQARAGAERVLQLLDLEPRIADGLHSRPLSHCTGRIELERVAFGYEQAEPILEDISLSIAPGERLGIVGGSGSGKTTLALLIARFYDPSSGHVRIDGQDVRTHSLASLRKQVGMVFEDSFLFSRTIAENIALGRPDATHGEIEAAARAAQAHGFIAALPKGYATRVGERGATLSGGQRQRISLARAILANPKILILDDATSAIDADTEEAIHHSLESVMHDRTTVIIAHRQSTLRLATRIVVLAGGKIVAQGTNEELLQSSELYRQLLAGPDPEAELENEAPLSRVTELDPAAWPATVAGSHVGRTASVESQISSAALRSVSAGGGGGGGPADLGGARAAFVPESPELLARVAALPALSGEPEVDVSALSEPQVGFSVRKFLGPFRLSLLLGLLLVVIDALTTLCAPMLIGRGVDRAIVGHSLKQLLLVSAALFLVQILSWANANAMQFQTGRTAERLLFALRTRTFAHLSWLSLDYYDRELGGRIMTRMTTDIEAFAQLLQQGLLTAIVSLLSCSGVLALLLVMDPRLSLAAFAILPALLAGTLVFRHLSAKAYLQARERISAANANLQESLAGVRVTQAYSRQAQALAHFTQLSSSYRDARLRSQQLLALYFPFLQLLSVLGKAATLTIGAGQIARGELSAGVLIAFLLYLDQFFTPLQQLSMVFDQGIQARVSLTRIRDLLGTPSRTPELAEPAPLGRVRGELRFQDVRFAYSTAAPEALRGISLEIAPGEVVALVGTTGAGKSTFVKLAARFYDATSGTVSIDGLPIGQVPLRAYRAQLGYVPQDPFLFSGTIRSNIAYGRPDASDHEVEFAARAVGAHDFIAALPKGYLTPLNSTGHSLSAGQRQLLCLARAELVDPAVLILDEATSNLDLQTEAEVQRAMRRVARGRTTMLIAHRLQTARVADRIVVIEDGLIVEQGPHEELVRANGRYAKLWQAFRRAERRAA
ncbi:MAG TPA: ABC transporter ATP-binding protein [Polyangiaceae bacterium]|nr:ABC transporter ATP-binding protein [Polyangiaceae bacterium]